MTEKPRYIDSHAHLTEERFAEDLSEILQRSREANIVQTVTVGDTVASSRAALDLAKREPDIFATVGIHPHHAESWDRETEKAIGLLCEEGLADGQLVALGETGLDFYYDNSPREEQAVAFRGQIALARELNLPLVMHCRDAWETFRRILVEENVGEVGGVVHCFSGTPEEAQTAVAMGLFIGLGGATTFKKNEMGREVARTVPLEYIVLETDAPYLAPVPKRGKRNEPAFIPYTAAVLAEQRNIAVEELAQAAEANTHRLFPLLK